EKAMGSMLGYAMTASLSIATEVEGVAARGQARPRTGFLNHWRRDLSFTRKGLLSMTTTSSRFFDELAKLMNNAAGAAQGVRREIDTLVKSQVERVLNDMGVVRREDFEVVRDMAQRAREENERLAARLSELETKRGAAKKPR